MALKIFYKPNKYKVLLFSFLFGVIFFIPYLKATPSPGTEKLVAAGHYPLIFIFLISSAVIIEVFTGQLNLNDVLLFFAFLFSFWLLYAFSCFIVFLAYKIRSSSRTNAIDDSPSPDNGYVVDLEEKGK